MSNQTHLACLAITTAIALGLAMPASAKSCPADLRSLDGQITDPRMKRVLEKPFDELVSKAGSLAAAIEEARTKLTELQARRAALAADASEVERRLYGEAILIGQHRVAGLECRLSD